MITKHISSAATTNGQRIANKGTSVGALNCFNSGVGAAFLKLYNKADPIVGTDIPVFVLDIQPSKSARADLSYLMQFPAALGLAITGGAADTDTTAVTLNQVKVSLVYGG